MESQSNSTFSSTSTLSIQDDEYEILWKIFYSLSLTTICFSIYLFVCFVIFLVRKNYLPLEDDHNLTQSRSYVNLTDSTNNHMNDGKKRKKTTDNSKQILTPNEKKIAQARQIMHYVLLTVISINLLRGLLEQLIFLIGGTSDYICSILTSLTIGLVGFAIYFAVLFLWMRQYVFYTNPITKRLSPRGLRCISSATIIEMIVALMINLSIHLWWRDYTASDGICRPLVGSRRIPVYLAFGIIVVTTVTHHILLTFLFLYPLIAHKKQMKQHNHKAFKASRSAERLLQCIKRTLIGSTIAITTDFFVSIASIALPEGMPMYALSVIFELNITLSLCCHLYTYANWKIIVFPWRIAEKNLNIKEALNKRIAIL